MPNWTPQQEAVFSAVRDTKANVCVEAVAGAGKSTTIIEASKSSPGANGLVCFNKHIADELQAKLNGAASACTLHSLGFRACQQKWGSELDQNKARDLLRAQQPKWFWKGRNDAWRPGDEAKAILDLARLCKLTLTDEACIDDLTDLADHHGIDCPTSCFYAVAELVQAAAARTDLVDFDDMIWLPVRHQIKAGSFDLLFVDEVQDLNRCQQQLARSAGKRLVIVGDSRQAIYGFSGSDSEALATLRRQLDQSTPGYQGNCVDAPLTVTFRCPVAHVDLAQRIVPDIQSADGAIDGLVYCLSPDSLPRNVMVGDLVISRCNAPLVELAYQLLRQGVPAVMRGRDIGKGLTDLVNQLKPADCNDLGIKLEDYRERETARLDRRNAAESQHQALNDKVDCLEQLATQCSTLDGLRGFVERLFTDDQPTGNGKIVLSSIHRAKGLEANRVIIVAPEKLPLIRKDSQPWEKVQEFNLAYIAATRAKRELVFAGDVPDVFGRVRCSVPAF